MPSQAGCEMLSLEWWARLKGALNETGVDVCQGAAQPHALLTDGGTAQDRGAPEPTEVWVGVRSVRPGARSTWDQRSLHRPHPRHPILLFWPGHLQATPTWPCGLKSRQRRKQPGHCTLKKPAQSPKAPPGLRASMTCQDSSHSSQGASGDNRCLPD